MREPSSELVRVVEQSTLPALLLRVPTGEIVAVSKEAAHLLDKPSADLIGRKVEEFATEDPTRLFELVASGSITGFQARRFLLDPDGANQSLQVWLRAAELVVPVEFAVSILWPTGRRAWSYLPGPEVIERTQVVGTVNSRLEIERVSDDVRVLGLPPEEAIGASLFRLVDVSSAADVLQALSEATRTRQSLCLVVNVLLDGVPAMAQLMIRPLEPAPSFSFSFVCPGDDAERERDTDERSLEQMGRGLHALALAETHALLDASALPGVAKLSSRELEITARLLTGDRVPAIAQALFLSQSTVRNHLSSVYRKLRVSSQQELIELFRESADRLRDQDTSSRSRER